MEGGTEGGTEGEREAWREGGRDDQWRHLLISSALSVV